MTKETIESLKKQLQESQKREHDLRIVLADITDALLLATKKKNILKKASDKIKTNSIRGGTFALVMDEVEQAKHQRAAEEKGHKYYNGMNKEKNFMEKSTNKLRELLEDKDVKITDSTTRYVIGREKPREITTTMILDLVSEINSL